MLNDVNLIFLIHIGAAVPLLAFDDLQSRHKRFVRL
jgi:hypothetical protein